MVNIVDRLALELGISKNQVNNVIALLDDGNTVPFISRYRKEQTGAATLYSLLRKRFSYCPGFLQSAGSKV